MADICLCCGHFKRPWGSDTGSTSETRPKKSVRKLRDKSVITHQSKFWHKLPGLTKTPRAGLLKQGLSVPVWTVLTINSFSDKIKLQYTPVYSIHREDVISEEKTRSGGGGWGKATGKREKWTGERWAEYGWGSGALLWVTWGPGPHASPGLSLLV